MVSRRTVECLNANRLLDVGPDTERVEWDASLLWMITHASLRSYPPLVPKSNQPLIHSQT